MLTDVPGMLSRAGIYPHSQPTAGLHDKAVSFGLEAHNSLHWPCLNSFKRLGRFE